MLLNSQIIQYLNHRMFQYTSAYAQQPINYAFLPQLAYQICYLPQEQIYFLPAPSPLEPKSDLSIFACAPLSSKSARESFCPILQSSGGSSSGVSVEASQKESKEELEIQKKEEGRGEAKQKFGRNISSNIFHLMVKFIKKQKKMKGVVAKIIQSNKLTIKVNEFYQIFKNRSYKLKAYANASKISQFWKGPSFTSAEMNSKNQKELECSIIFRIVSRLYLNYHHLPYVFNSLKIKTESKRLHMDSIRKILAM